MASYNRVVLVGNLTRDPEYKQLMSGQAVCRLGLAVNRQFKNRQTDMMVQEVCYVDIDVWGPQAESCNQYLQKGRPVLIEGRLKLDTWEDAQGQTRSKHCVVADRVVFLGAASANVASVGSEATTDSGVRPAAAPEANFEKEIMDQIEAIKNKPKAKSKVVAKETKDISVEPEGDDSDGEVAFKDEAPFKDELPF